VQVINWWSLIGIGPTKAKSLENIEENYKKEIQASGYPTRPGTKVPIKFSATSIIDKYPELVDEFIETILEHVSMFVFVSDSTSLYDFSQEESLDTYYDKIEKIYNVNVRDIKDGNLANIIERIAKLKYKIPEVDINGREGQ
jgi:hypothetical protein